MKSAACKLIILLIITSLCLTGCISPRTPAEKCTVLLEDNEAISCARQVYEVDRYDSISITIGVPHGQRIASVNYDNYSLSAKTGESASYDYYTVTLHQIRYSTVIRFTTAQAFTTAYHPGAGTGASISVTEESPHLYFNTLPYRQQFSRVGYVPIGWNTAPDGSGIQVSFGSRIDHRDVSHLDLYMQWLPCTPEEDLSYEIHGDEVTITGYRGSGDVVIPERISGKTVTAIAQGAFGDLNVDYLVLPPSLKTVESGAFGTVTARELYVFDSIESLPENAFAGYSIESIRIQAVLDPVYSGSYFDTLADKMDYLDSLKDQAKIVLFCGSSARFGYDSPMLEKAFPDYRVVNMGVYAYTNMLPLAQMVLPLMQEGDILLSSPELDAIDMQFCGETDLDKETFCMMESNYDMFARLDSRNYTNIFGAFDAYNRSRQDMTPRSYLDSASYYDEDGNPQQTASYNQQGDYILLRENNILRDTFGIKRAYYNADHIRPSDLDGLNRVYDAFAARGVRVYFTYSPRSSISISDDSTEESIAALDLLLRTSLHAKVISPIHDSLMDPLYFFGTDNHLSTEGVRIHTQAIINDLKAALEGEE